MKGRHGGSALFRQRKEQSKSSSFPRYTFCVDCTVHFFDKLMCDGQSKTASFFRRSGIAFVKPFKNMFQFFFSNSY